MSRKSDDFLNPPLPQKEPTLRDQFAMAALTGLIGKDEVVEDNAEAAYRYADAMLQAREGE